MKSASQSHIRITKNVALPNRVQLARFLRTPELGPKILFFSGGSALRTLSEDLIRYTHNSLHIVTPFDSGGSSARLREAFSMLSVGDIRNRLMSLADQTIQGNPDVYELFSYRFPKNVNREELENLLIAMIDGREEHINRIPDPLGRIIRNHLNYFYEMMPRVFDLRGASVGNLILAGGYLNNGHHIDPVIFLFSKLAEVRGTVRPVVNLFLHLMTELEDGTILCGQHQVTGKEVQPIESPVRRIWLTETRSEGKATEIAVRAKVETLIENAELICYPMGSFYSSLIANFLPRGVGAAVAINPCPKIYIPNTGDDPEQLGMTLLDSVQKLLHYLKRSGSNKESTEQLLNFVLIDSTKGNYQGLNELSKIRRKGIQIIDMPLISELSAPHLDPILVNEVLLSLA